MNHIKLPDTNNKVVEKLTYIVTSPGRLVKFADGVVLPLNRMARRRLGIR